MQKRNSLISFLITFALLLAGLALPVGAVSSVTQDVLLHSGLYNGAAREDTKDLYLYGDVHVNGYVDYTVEIPQDGVYRLDATYGVQGAKELTQLQFAIDGVWLEEITQLPKTAAAWTKVTDVLHAKLPFQAGSRVLRISLCGQDVKSGVLLHSLTLTRVGEYAPIISYESTPLPEMDITNPTDLFNGEKRTDSVYLYGENSDLSWVEYPITVEKSGTYRLLSSLAVSGGDTAELYIAIDGVKLEKITLVPPYRTDWVQRDAVLYSSIPLSAGAHTIRIYQAERVSHLLLYSLYFESCDDSLVLYSVEADKTVCRVSAVQTAGAYRVKYARKRMDSGVMIAGAYQNGQLISAVLTPCGAGSYSVLADFPHLPANSTVKTFFLQDTTTLTPIEDAGVFASNAPAAPRDIYVSPAGSDSGDGTEEYPFATIEKAKETVRTFGDFTADVSVYIAPGEYKLAKPLTFSEQDSGKSGYSVIYRALDPENPPVISGGTKIEGWSPWANGIWKAPADIENTRMLYINENPAIRARSKYLYEPKEMLENGVLVSSVNFPEGFAHPEELELVWPLNWTAQRTPVEEAVYGEEGVHLLLRQSAYEKATEESQNPYTRPDAAKPFYIENALELLDEAGEFYFDKTNREIYYYPFPEEELSTAAVYAGTTDFLVRISGSSVMKKAENIAFESLSFRYGAWNAVTDSPYGVVIGQADAIKGETPAYVMGSLNGGQNRMIPAQFQVEKAKNIRLEGCTFSCLGSSAVSMANSVSSSKILGNRILDVAGSGIVLGHWNHVNPADMGAGMERCESIEVANNVIRRAANEFMNCCGISVYYTSGVNIHHNDIRELPYTGISLGWGWGLETVADFGGNRICNNYIEDVTGVLDDGAHIYTLGASHDNLISGNHLVRAGDHRGGIYLDQATAGVTVTENVTEQCVYWLNARQNIGITDTVTEHNFYDSNAKYSWVTGIYDKNNELSDVVDGETTFEEKTCYNTYRSNARVSGDWPEQAQNIIAAAGLDEAYEGLLKGTDIPSWRTDFRAKVPKRTFAGTNGWTEAEDFYPEEGTGYLRQGDSIPVGSIPYREDASDVALASLNYWGVRNYVITNTQSGDWFAYPYHADRAGDYNVLMRLANGGNTSYINVYVDDALVISRAEIPNTGDYHTYETVNLGSVPLSAGAHTVRFEIRDTGLHLDRWSFSSDAFSENDSSYNEGIK